MLRDSIKINKGFNVNKIYKIILLCGLIIAPSAQLLSIRLPLPKKIDDGSMSGRKFYHYVSPFSKGVLEEDLILGVGILTGPLCGVMYKHFGADIEDAIGLGIIMTPICFVTGIIMCYKGQRKNWFLHYCDEE